VIETGINVGGVEDTEATRESASAAVGQGVHLEEGRGTNVEASNSSIFVAILY
jgi:hypothetical protein